ncbi:hypothetical protein ACFOD4_02720 [Pseudoroseomonas globiformis]|uniref:Calcium-binding protein n=1 Tax=Teichococcus globiformis TaxID=2307229 RepID=A0ABV7FUB6_9PROT
MAVIIGSDGNDNLVSPDAWANDTIYGLGGNDRIEARGGDDLIIPGPGNNRIEGGDGRDTVVLPGTLEQYEFFRYENEGVIRGAEGVNTLLDVEAVRTDASGTLDLSNVPEFLAYAYLATYDSLADAFGTDRDAAWDHFTTYGAADGLTIQFDGMSYLAANTDVLASPDYGANVDEGAALHYLRHGRDEGRELDFNGTLYVAGDPGLTEVFRGGDTDALGTLHYVQYGFDAGIPTDRFNAASYAEQNPDLAAAGLVSDTQLAQHWIDYGSLEGRSGAYDSLIG